MRHPGIYANQKWAETNKTECKFDDTGVAA